MLGNHLERNKGQPLKTKMQSLTMRNVRVNNLVPFRPIGRIEVNCQKSISRFDSLSEVCPGILCTR